MPLTDKLRAAVFARDRGICGFSGLSLWLLDYGTSPIGQADWPDHIVPVSRGGKDTLDNLVCASHVYNRKKLNNTRDRVYLFRNGQPTEDFFWIHGELDHWPVHRAA
jgi:5-methylcytosine-specific restriction endonuclease McrA